MAFACAVIASRGGGADVGEGYLIAVVCEGHGGRAEGGSFAADQVAKTADGYRLTGTLEIHGTPRPQTVEVRVADSGDALALSARVQVTQSDFGVKPYSLMMGALKVADEVTIDFSATHAT